MGFFGGLAAEKYDRKYTDRELVMRMTSYFKPQIGRLVGMSFLVLIASGLDALLPIIVSNGVDAIEQDTSGMLIGLVAGGMMFIGAVNWLVAWGGRRLTIRAIADVVQQLASDAFNAAAKHDLSFYDANPSGKVVSRITTDTQDFGQLVTLLTDNASMLIVTLILSVVLFRINWRLTLYVFGTVPLAVGLALSFRHLARKVTREGMRSVAIVNATIKETVSGIAIAKNFRQEQKIYNEFSDANMTSYNVNLRRGLTLNILFPVLNFLGGMATAVMVYVGGMNVVTGAVNAGAWFLFIQSMDRFVFPIMSISNFWAQIQNGLSAAERVFALIDADPAVVQVENQSVEPVL